MEEITTKWTGDMGFRSKVNGHDIQMDAYAEFGGQDQGPRPKPLLLATLSGCTGMDIASLLKKMRVEIDDFTINVSASLTDEHPKHYNKIHLKYMFTGTDLQKEKIEKTVKLSQERYCGISYMLSKSAKVTYDIAYMEKEIEAVN